MIENIIKEEDSSIYVDGEGKLSVVEDTNLETITLENIIEVLNSEIANNEKVISNGCNGFTHLFIPLLFMIFVMGCVDLDFFSMKEFPLGELPSYVFIGLANVFAVGLAVSLVVAHVRYKKALVSLENELSRKKSLLDSYNRELSEKLEKKEVINKEKEKRYAYVWDKEEAKSACVDYVSADKRQFFKKRELERKL